MEELVYTFDSPLVAQAQLVRRGEDADAVDVTYNDRVYAGCAMLKAREPEHGIAYAMIEVPDVGFVSAWFNLESVLPPLAT